MKRAISIFLSLILIGYIIRPVSEPDRCSLCADQSRHALCVVNLSTGEKVELDIYEPHPFIVGEIAKEQPGGYFSFIRGAGIEGYKIAANSIVFSIPSTSAKLNQHFFCNSCRKILRSESCAGYVLADLKYPDKPMVYFINSSTAFDVRCYSVSVKKNSGENKYEVVITGNYEE